MRTALTLVALVLLAGCTEPPAQSVLPEGEPADQAPAGITKTPFPDWVARFDSTEPKFIMDARSGEEYVEGHVPGAISIPYRSVQDRAADLPVDSNTPIFVYCMVGQRASTAADTLQQMGYTRIHVLDGGIHDWENAGRALEQGSTNNKFPEPVGGGPNVTQMAGQMRYALGTPVYSFAGIDIVRVEIDEAREAGITGWVVQLEWTPNVDAMAELSLWGRSYIPDGNDLDDPEPHFYVQGTSPIRLVVPFDEVQGDQTFSIFVRPPREPGGVAVQQDWVAHVATFEGIPLDPTFNMV